MIHTKNYWENPTKNIERSMEDLNGLGYSLSIPWNDVNTAGWSNTDPQIMKVWGTENQITTRDDPEYFATGNLIRSNVLPAINPADPIYTFSRKDHTYTVW